MPIDPKDCEHRSIAQMVEAGEPKQTWICDACDQKFVTVDLLLEIIKGIVAAMSLYEVEL
ncbi:MAG TPA: hypothetical protein VIT65_13860 [Microlunatus sp.]